MPEKDGFQTLEEIKNKLKEFNMFKKTYFVAMSGYSDK